MSKLSLQVPLVVGRDNVYTITWKTKAKGDSVGVAADLTGYSIAFAGHVVKDEETLPDYTQSPDLTFAVSILAQTGGTLGQFTITASEADIDTIAPLFGERSLLRVDGVYESGDGERGELGTIFFRLKRTAAQIP